MMSNDKKNTSVPDTGNSNTTRDSVNSDRNKSESNHNYSEGRGSIFEVMNTLPPPPPPNRNNKNGKS